MQLEECYQVFGGDYQSVSERIPSEAIIRKFIHKFVSEPSYGTLCESLESGNYVEAFRASHSLKGIAQNLSFQRLAVSAGALTECLRNSEERQVDIEACKKLLEEVSRDYQAIIEAVKNLED